MDVYDLIIIIKKWLEEVWEEKYAYACTYNNVSNISHWALLIFYLLQLT